jgi:hypothetical protein
MTAAGHSRRIRPRRSASARPQLPDNEHTAANWRCVPEAEVELALPGGAAYPDRMARVIEYALVGAGWAQAAITLDGRRVELDASHIHDTFTDIVEGLLRACRGQEAVEWVYFHEPDATHAYLTGTNNRRAIALRRFPDLRVPRPRLGNPGTLIVEGEVLLRQLVADIIVAGSRMIDAHGEEGYLQSWRRPFPTRALADLGELRRNSVLF